MDRFRRNLLSPSWLKKCTCTHRPKPAKACLGPMVGSYKFKKPHSRKKGTEAEKIRRKEGNSRITETKRNGLSSRQTKQNAQKREKTDDTGEGTVGI